MKGWGGGGGGLMSLLHPPPLVAVAWLEIGMKSGLGRAGLTNNNVKGSRLNGFLIFVSSNVSLKSRLSSVVFLKLWPQAFLFILVKRADTVSFPHTEYVGKLDKFYSPIKIGQNLLLEC